MAAQSPKNIVMIAGEASGDLHGAHVIEALRHRNKAVSISGAGGDAMRRAGARIIVDAKELSVNGFTAVFLKAPQILKILRRLKRHLRQTRPDLLILIDFPDFNLHLAGFAKKMGTPILYYVSPTIWAWRSGRIKKIKERVDHMAVILPFEKPIYDRHHVPATYVGHPLLDDAAKQSHAARLHSFSDDPAIALLPGSRQEEVERLLPVMVQAAQILQQANKSVKFVISKAPSIDISIINNMIDSNPLGNVRIVEKSVSTIFSLCKLAIIASGTASLEAAIYGVPTIIIYQVSAISAWIGKRLIDVPHIGLANLIAGQRIFPELIQEEATAENVAQAANELLTDKATYEDMLKGIEKVQKLLGESGASDRVAAIAYTLMMQKAEEYHAI